MATKKAKYTCKSGVLKSVEKTPVYPIGNGEDFVIEHPQGIRLTESECERFGISMEAGKLYEFADKSELEFIYG